MTVEEAHNLIRQITDTVNRQLEDRVRIYEEKILPALRRNHVVFYQSKSEVEDFHKEFVHRFFYGRSVSLHSAGENRFG